MCVYIKSNGSKMTITSDTTMGSTQLFNHNHQLNYASKLLLVYSHHNTKSSNTLILGDGRYILRYYYSNWRKRHYATSSCPRYKDTLKVSLATDSSYYSSCAVSLLFSRVVLKWNQIKPRWTTAVYLVSDDRTQELGLTLLGRVPMPASYPHLALA